MYKAITKILKTVLSDRQIFKFGFNSSPMYRRTTGKILEVSEDLLHVKIKIPLSFKNRNYVGSIFGGSLFSATDPIYMVQLINILGENYVVWDKNALINYKRPAKDTAYAQFTFTAEEIDSIKKKITKEGEISLVKTLNIVSKEGAIFAELSKTIYIADKTFYKKKRQRKKMENKDLGS